MQKCLNRILQHIYKCNQNAQQMSVKSYMYDYKKWTGSASGSLQSCL